MPFHQTKPFLIAWNLGWSLAILWVFRGIL